MVVAFEPLQHQGKPFNVNMSSNIDAAENREGAGGCGHGSPTTPGHGIVCSQGLPPAPLCGSDALYFSSQGCTTNVDTAQLLQDVRHLLDKLAKVEVQVATELGHRKKLEMEAAAASTACKMYFSMAQAAEEKAKAADVREGIVRSVLSRAVHSQAENIFQLHRWIGRAQGILEAHGLEVPPGGDDDGFGDGEGGGDSDGEASSAMDSSGAFCMQ